MQISVIFKPKGVSFLLEVITGCMYSGKTTLLIDKVREYESKGFKVLVLKPIQDSRYSQYDVVSHDGIKVKGIAVDDVDEMIEIIEEEEFDVLAIDEVQFFENWDMAEVINSIANKGFHVMVCGLDLNFKGEPYGILPSLMAYADVVYKKHTECRVCGKVASRSQRLVNGKPAKRSDKIFAVGNHISYEARCRFHHEVVD